MESLKVASINIGVILMMSAILATSSFLEITKF